MVWKRRAKGVWARCEIENRFMTFAHVCFAISENELLMYVLMPSSANLVCVFIHLRAYFISIIIKCIPYRTFSTCAGCVTSTYIDCPVVSLPVQEVREE